VGKRGEDRRGAQRERARAQRAPPLPLRTRARAPLSTSAPFSSHSFQVDPELDAPTLPSRREDEFRPFVRRLPEFKAWWAGVRAIALAFMLTFVPAADVPVFWPILVLYFCLLAAVTLKRQVKHMLRHRYVPWDLGRKTRYGGGSGSGGRSKGDAK